MPLRPARAYELLLSAARRGYAIQSPGAPALQVFNRHTKWLQKERAAANVEESRKVDYLRDEVASRLCERLLVRQYTSCHTNTESTGHQSTL